MPKPILLPIKLLTVTLLTAACASNQAPYAMPINSGYQVQINQAYAADSPRFYFQQGRLVSEDTIDSWATHCRLQLSDGRNDEAFAVSVEPERFDVTAVRLRYQSSKISYRGIQAGDTLIGLGLTGHRARPEYSSRRSEPPDSFLYQVEISLSSESQPEVQTLTCSRKWNTRLSLIHI